MKTEILEGNKLIAKFDGWAISQDQKQVYLHATDSKLNSLIGFDDCIYLQEAKYHSSWDWLMPVVEKIEHFQNVNSKGYSFHVCIFDKDCQIYEFLDEEETPLIEKEAETKLEAVWLAVVEFIKCTIKISNENTNQIIQETVTCLRNDKKKSTPTENKFLLGPMVKI